MNGSPPLPPSKPSDSLEDAGTKALSDALRSSFAIIKFVMLGLVLVFLGSGFYTVGTQEKAVILRLGRPVGAGETALRGPGPHLSFPYPIDEVVKIPVGEVQTLRSTAGWYASNPSGKELPPDPYLDPARDGYLLTADGNIIHVEGILRYRIREPGLTYMFGFENASNQVLNALNNALVYAAAHFTIDDALTRDTTGFRELVGQRLDQLVEKQGLGIGVDQLAIRAAPPRQLTENFKAVVEAGVRRTKLLNEAHSYASATTNQARALAATTQNEGENRRTLLVEFINAEATNFLALLPAYQRNPALFTQQRQTETFQRIMTNAQFKIVAPQELSGQPSQLRLLLNRPPEKPKPPKEAPPDEH